MLALVVASLLAAAPESNVAPGAAQAPAADAAGPLRPEPRSDSAVDDAAVRRRIEALLGTNGPITPDRWRRLGPAAVPALEEIAGDSRALSTRRARALEGLVALGAPSASKLLVRLAQSEEEPFAVRLAAVRGIGRTLPASRQLAALRGVLEGARDAQLRAVAAEVIARHPSTGCPAVRKQIEREPPESASRFEAARRRCARE